MHIYRGIWFFFFILLTSCQFSSSTSTAIAEQFLASGRKSVNLTTAVPGNWDRVCILGPYSNDSTAAETLGFNWPAETLTDIYQNEAISLLLFVQNGSVASYVEHSRSFGDFTNLAGRCFLHDNTKFLQVAHPVNGRPGLFPADKT